MATSTITKDEVLENLRSGRRAFVEAVRSLPKDRWPEGCYEEGWTAKDLLAHIGSWLAEAGLILERVLVGTFRREEIDVDAMNEQFLEAMGDLPLRTVQAQAWAARTRMLQAWRALPELTPEAAFWISKSGAEHYAEHLPRLREWVAALRSGH